MNIKGKALLAGCIALAFSNMALAEDIKVAVVGAMSGPVAQYGTRSLPAQSRRLRISTLKAALKATNCKS